MIRGDFKQPRTVNRRAKFFAVIINKFKIGLNDFRFRYREKYQYPLIKKSKIILQVLIYIVELLVDSQDFDFKIILSKYLIDKVKKLI